MSNRVPKKKSKKFDIMELYNAQNTIGEIAQRLYAKIQKDIPDYTLVEARLEVEQIILEGKKKKQTDTI
jgi:hypothetical protein